MPLVRKRPYDQWALRLVAISIGWGLTLCMATYCRLTPTLTLTLTPTPTLTLTLTLTPTPDPNPNPNPNQVDPTLKAMVAVSKAASNVIADIAE